MKRIRILIGGIVLTSLMLVGGAIPGHAQDCSGVGTQLVTACNPDPNCTLGPDHTLPFKDNTTGDCYQ